MGLPRQLRAKVKCIGPLAVRLEEWTGLAASRLKVCCHVDNKPGMPVSDVRLWRLKQYELSNIGIDSRQWSTIVLRACAAAMTLQKPSGKDKTKHLSVGARFPPNQKRSRRTGSHLLVRRQPGLDNPKTT